MKKFSVTSLMLIAQCSMWPNAYAEEQAAFDVFPRIGVSLNQLAYVRSDGTKLDANYTALVAGLTFNYNNIYFDAGADLFGVDFLENQGEITGIERQDYTFTAGYIPLQDLSVFLGYTVSEMKDDFQGEFQDDRGYFVGATYGYLVNGVNLAGTLAYADLDGNVTVDGSPADNTKGQTSGFSYGFTISGPFRETMAYTVNIRIRKYEYEVEGSSAVTDKEIISTTLGLVF